jgi:hypothetical protein
MIDAIALQLGPCKVHLKLESDNTQLSQVIQSGFLTKTQLSHLIEALQKVYEAMR